MVCYKTPGDIQKNLASITYCECTQSSNIFKMKTVRKGSVQFISYLIIEIELFPPKIKNKTRIALPSILPTIILELFASTVRKINTKNIKKENI